MEAIQTANNPQDAKPSFESVWAVLKEISEEHKKTERIVERNAYEMGKLTKRMGEVVEYMVAPTLRKKFRNLGYVFHQVHQNSDIEDEENKIFLEIDVKLENGEKAMLVEVKTKLTTRDVQDHVKRLKKMRVYANLHGDKRTFLGSVAGVVIKANVKEYALKQGFFVIEPSRGEPSPLCGSVEYTGETFNIIPPNGQPKEW